MSAKLQIANDEDGKSDPQLRIEEGEQATIDLWKTIGAIQLANSIAANLSAQTIHALENVRDKKLYLAAGFSTFDEFLTKHPASPMSHDTFRRRVNLLESEGDLTFDLLTSLKVPVSARKLLAGQITVQGDEIQIGDSKCCLSDQAGIIVLINSLHHKAQEQSRTIERGKKDFEKKKRRIDELEQQVAHGATVSENGAPHARALVSLLGNFQLLAEEVASLRNDDELKRFAPLAFEHIAEAKKRLEFAFGHKAPASDLDMSEEDKEKLIASES